jgi:hypothetical protein
MLTARILFPFSLFFSAIIVHAQNNIPPIGQWREHLNYQNTQQVVKGDKIYCATATNLFSVDTSGEIERYSKVTGLNDIGVQCIGWDATTQQLLIAYSNSNIDVIGTGGSLKNIGDIKRSSVAGNKTIYQVYCNNGFAYLSTGLGIIVANLSKYEIKDTWYIGSNGSQLAVNAFTSDGNFFYAATGDGLKSIPISNTNPSNYANWQNLGGVNGLPFGSVTNIAFTNNQLIAQKSDSLFILNGNSWHLLYADTAWPIVNITAAENKLLICERTLSGNARVLIMNTNGSIEKITAQSGVISLPRSAITDNGILWVADQYGGLAKFSPGVQSIIPNGPPGAATGEIIINNSWLYAAAGSVNSSWNYQYNRNGIYNYQNDTWNYQGYYNTPALDSVLDFISLAFDPRNGSVWAGSYGGGLVNFMNGSIPKIYKNNNSTLQAAIGDPLSYRVSGLAFDQNNHLWISNYGAPQNLQVRKADSTWKAFTIPFTHIENAVAQIVVDDINQLWIMSPKGNGVFCFNYGQTVDALSDDKWKFYQQGPGIGNLPSNTILSLLKDKNGFIWVGTDKGIGIIRCISDVFSAQGCDAILPVVQLDQFAGLLFGDESVQCMAVDGANRKWIGTKNGVWLISPDGDKIIYRFTAENSPLFDNDVNHIAVNPSTGEVFISTLYGICSFRSTATEGGNTNSDVLVFPNPVPPGYNGTIAIRGLVNDALVKITELNGRLVYQTRALGGQAVWDGHNYNGGKVASGVYLVIVRDDSNTETIVTKIVIVSGR